MGLWSVIESAYEMQVTDIITLVLIVNALRYSSKIESYWNLHQIWLPANYGNILGCYQL